jgi:glycopeptide antibiotics resistance protein
MKQMKFIYEAAMSALFALYMYVVFKVILFKFGSMDFHFLWQQLQTSLGNPSNIHHRLQTANFHPFVTISQNIHSLSSYEVINLYGNILIFIPFGMFLMLLSKKSRMSWIGVGIRSFALSLSLECLEVLFLIGSFDVDDLILNVSGGLIGCCLWQLMLAASRLIGVSSFRFFAKEQQNQRSEHDRNEKDGKYRGNAVMSRHQ